MSNIDEFAGLLDEWQESQNEAAACRQMEYDGYKLPDLAPLRMVDNINDEPIF